MKVPEGSRLFRRIHMVHLVEGDNGTTRLSSGAFRDAEMSIYVESVMASLERSPKTALIENPNDMLVAISVEICQGLGLPVEMDPVLNEPAHGLVLGKKTSKVTFQGQQKKISCHLRDSAEWVIPAVAPDWSTVLDRKRALGLE